MNRFPRWIGVVLALAVLVLLALTVLFYLAVDEQDLRDRLVATVNDKLDARLAIDGELELQILPSLQVSVGDVRLTGPGESGAELAAAQVLRFGADLLPMLRGKLHVSELTIEGLRLHLRREADGHGNWERLRRAPAPPAAPTATAATSAEGNAAPAAEPDPVDESTELQLAIDRIRIEDGSVDYRDEQAGKRYQLQFLSLQGDEVNLQGAPFRLEGGGRLVVDEGRQDLQIGFGTGISADTHARTVALADATLKLAPSQGPALELRLPALRIALDRKQLEADEFVLAAEGLAARATLSADWSHATAIRASGELHVDKADLGALAPLFGAPMPAGLDPALLNAVAVDTVYQVAGDRIDLQSIKLRAGELQVEGELHYIATQPARLDARLQSPALDLDRLMPTPPDAPEVAQAEVATPDPGAAPAPEPDLAAQLQYIGTIDARVGSLKRHGFELQQVDARLVLQPGNARLEKLQAALYGGTLSASGQLDARNDGRLDLEAKLAAVDLRPLLQATKQQERFEGRLDATLALHASGKKPKHWIDSLAGPVELVVKDPVVRELSVEKLVCKAAATLNQETLSAPFAADTRLDKLEAALDFSKGIGSVRTLHAALPDMELRGKGKIDLPARKLDLQLDARVTHDLATLDPACRMTRKMQRVEWPLSCKGSFDEPPGRWCGIDKDDLAKIATQLAGDKLKDKLRDGLDKLFKRH